MEKPKNVFECSVKINPEERKCIYTGKVFEETLSLLLDRPCDDCPFFNEESGCMRVKAEYVLDVQEGILKKTEE
jgi:hypothetical protein